MATRGAKVMELVDIISGADARSPTMLLEEDVVIGPNKGGINSRRLIEVQIVSHHIVVAGSIIARA